MAVARHNVGPSVARGRDKVRPSKRTNQIELLPFSILSISNVSEDHRSLREILRHSGWRIAEVRTCKAALSRLSQRPLQVVICESNLPDGNWRDVLLRIQSLAAPPAFIVSSRLADDHLWAEVLNLGGYDVLARPLSESEVKYMVSTIRMREQRPATQAVCAATV